VFSTSEKIDNYSRLINDRPPESDPGKKMQLPFLPKIFGGNTSND
jgi:hypothetical protein